MRKVLLLVVAAIAQYISIPLHASALKQAGKTELSDNPFIAYGYNPRTKITTGYLAALRTAPGRTDECKMVFSTNPDKADEFFVKYLGEVDSSEIQDRLNNRASLVFEKNILYLKFLKKNMGGDCDWILPFVVETESFENSTDVMVEMGVQYAGDWIGVYAIGSRKARFYSRPDSSSVQKAFLVKDDVIYVYDEQLDWYFVKYKKGKLKIEGWIKKSDALQP